MTDSGPHWKASKRPALGWLGRPVSWTAIVLVFVGLGIAMAVFVSVGGVDVSADKPDGWLSEHLLHFVFKRSEASRSNSVTAPNDLSAESRVRLAAQHFDMICANCHGRPGFGQSVVALSMSPRPQYLPKVVGQFTDRELYLIIEHGVKYSAMPSWPTDGRGDEVWSMVAFLRRLPRLDAKTYLQMTALAQTPGAGPSGSGGDTSLRPANAQRNTPPVDEFLYAAPSSGFSDQGFHDNPVQTCARCHGADGSGAVTGGEAPNLTIEDADYMRAALQAYTTGARKSGFMQNIAAQLSSAQIATLANDYAGLPVKTAPQPPPDPALSARGQAIATQGIPERAIPACDYCHESAGSKVTGAPHIAGQSETFLRRQLEIMRLGDRGSSRMWNPMPAVAHGLSDKDIAALAAYYAGLTPVRAASAGQVSPTLIPVAGANGDLGAAKRIFSDYCLKCHVNEGRGDLEGNFPNLTIETTPYAAQSLYVYRTRARPNEKMREVADSLNFEQMASLAQYLNSLPPRPALAKIDPDSAARGAAIATRGAPGRGVPACLSCHDKKGVAALPLIPALQGQNAHYLRKRLDNFAKPYDANLGALNPMPAIASKLTPGERADLASYFAAAQPLQKPAQP